MVAGQEVGCRQEPHLVGNTPPNHRQRLLANGKWRAFAAGSTKGTRYLVPPPETPHIFLNPGETRICR
jgi:hypothetical protein